MKMSLGLIETRGFTAAISAADAACKAASVEIIGYKKVGSGLVTIFFQGEVAAVQMGIESGVAVVVPPELVVSSLVIARPDKAVVSSLCDFDAQKELKTVTQLVNKPVMAVTESYLAVADNKSAPIDLNLPLDAKSDSLSEKVQVTKKNKKLESSDGKSRGSKKR